MKTILIILGMIFLIVITIAVTMIGVVAVRGKALDRGSKRYVDSTVPLLVSNWDESELLSRASPELMRATDKQELDKLYHMFRELGKLRAYEGSKGQSYMSMTTQNGKSVTAVYTCKADFDKGPADIKITLVKHGGKWEIAGFRVDSEVFHQH